MLDRHGIITSWNPGSECISGYKAQEIIGKHLSIFYLDKDIQAGKPQRELEVAFSAGNFQEEGEQVRKDGSTYWATVVIMPFQDENGQDLGFGRVTRDITARKLSEFNLGREQALLKSVLDSTSDGVIVAQGDGKLLLVNPSAQRMTGLADLKDSTQRWNEPAGWYRTDGQTPYEREDLPLVRARRGEYVNDEEIVLKHDTLRYPVWLRLSTRLLGPESGIPGGAVLAFHDVTGRIAYERELSRSNAELQQFAYVAAHDLQEPLRTITSYLDLLTERYLGKLDEKANKYIKNAQTGAQRMQVLIEDLLAYSRIASRAQTLVPTDSARLVSKALANLEKSINEAGATITTESLPSIMVDPSQLIQVFQNLISNAVKYRNNRPPKIHILAQRKGPEWLFSIEDNGIGFEMEYANRIFLIFQRLHGRTEYSGTGIGLAICRRIIERHGGTIWTKSEPGKGSTFFFTIPATDKEVIDRVETRTHPSGR